LQFACPFRNWPKKSVDKRILIAYATHHADSQRFCSLAIKRKKLAPLLAISLPKLPRYRCVPISRFHPRWLYKIASDVQKQVGESFGHLTEVRQSRDRNIAPPRRSFAPPPGAKLTPLRPTPHDPKARQQTTCARRGGAKGIEFCTHEKKKKIFVGAKLDLRKRSSALGCRCSPRPGRLMAKELRRRDRLPGSSCTPSCRRLAISFWCR
jgi:hypothetical protein